MSEEEKFYVYALLDPRKPGEYKYGEYEFEYKPFYIGKGSGDRMYVHLYEAYGKYDIKRGCRSYKCNKIRKIKEETGKDPIIIRLEEELSESSSLNLEILLISIMGKYNEGGILTNVTDGGDGTSGLVHRDKSKEKISIANSGKKNFWFGKRLPKHIRKKISIANSGKNHYNYGKSLSEEHKQKIRNSLKGEKNHWFGKKLPEDVKKKISESRKGKYTGENNPMFGVSRFGKDNPMFGKKHSDDTKKKISLAKKGNTPWNIKPVVINGIVFESIKSASEELGIHRTTVAKRLRMKKDGYQYLDKDGQ